MKIYLCIILFLLSSTIHSVAQDLPNNTTEEKQEGTSPKFPFNFDFILGMTKQVAKGGSNLSSERYSLLELPYEIISSKVIMLGKLHVDSTYSPILEKYSERRYYEAYLNGKQFYISDEDVILDDENKSRLDSLIQTPISIQNSFNNESRNFAWSMHVNRIDKFLGYLDKHKSYGLSIMSWGIYDESEYTDGTSFAFDLINPTKKTIKYITVNVVGYNPVNDRVASKGKYVQSVKCVGPIKPGVHAKYRFEYVWFTDLVENAKITSITVQYMDGSVKTISNIKPIEWAHEDFEYYIEDYPELQEIRTSKEPEVEENTLKPNSEVKMPQLNNHSLVK